MKIQWLGHSAFKLIESTGASVITDPFEASVVGYGMAYISSDAITSSHGHNDHNNFKGVKGTPTIINTTGIYDINGIQIHSILSYHDKELGKIKGKNIIYKFQLDGVTVCHLGDLGEECTPQLVEQIMPVNILLVPVGGNSTLDAEAAKEYVDKIMPDIVIPMHYKTKHSDLDIDKLEPFLKEFDNDQIVELDASTLEFDRDDFGQDQTKIIIPKRFKG